MRVRSKPCHVFFFSCWKHSHSRTSGDADKLMLLLWIILFVLQYSCTGHAHLSLQFICSFFFFFQPYHSEDSSANFLSQNACSYTFGRWAYVRGTVLDEYMFLSPQYKLALKFRELSIWIKCSANITLFLWERKFFSYFAYHIFLVDPRIILKLSRWLLLPVLE